METQEDYSNATAIYEGDAFVHAVPWWEHDHGEDHHATDSSLWGFLAGYIRGKWGASVSLQREDADRKYAVTVDGSIVATIRVVTLDLRDPAQAAICGIAPYRERDWKRDLERVENPNPENADW
jgi:hypothetical protein